MILIGRPAVFLLGFVLVSTAGCSATGTPRPASGPTPTAAAAADSSGADTKPESTGAAPTATAPAGSQSEDTAGATAVGPGTAVIEVRGMSCPLCANNINNELKDLPGVQKVDVDLGTGLVTVRLAPGNSVTAEQLSNAVHQSGFTVGSVRMNPSEPAAKGGD